MARTGYTGTELDEIAKKLAAVPPKDPKRRIYGPGEDLTYLTAAIKQLLDDGHGFKDVVDVLKEHGVKASVAKIKAIRSGVEPSEAAQRSSRSAGGKAPRARDARVQGKLDV